MRRVDHALFIEKGGAAQLPDELALPTIADPAGLPSWWLP
jgi:hypothetical protein